MINSTDLFHSEEQQWYRTFLDIQYFNSWRENYKRETKDVPSIEFTLSRKCNLKCTYCYYTRHGKELYPDNIDKVNSSIDNCMKLVSYLTREKLAPSRIEIFGGEAVSSSQYKRLFDILYAYAVGLPEHLRKSTPEGFSILFPLNVIFLKDPDYYNLLITEQKRFLKIGVAVAYSISFDGKYCDPISRPAHDSSFAYDDEFYATVSRFCQEASLSPGFHPMISQDNIKYWKENIDWFFEYIKLTYRVSSKEAIKYLYLLEVRNEDWSVESLEYFYDFINYLAKKIFEDPEICNKDANLLFTELAENRFLNLSSSLFSYVPRGLTCSLQTALYVRTGDLSIIPCHRLSYEPFLAGKFEVSPGNGELTGNIITEYPYMHMAAVVNNFHNHAPCAKCEIRSLCPGPCLGANYEATKDPFIESPAMCRMEKTKILALLRVLSSYGLLNRFKTLVEQYSHGTNPYHGFMRSKYMQLEALILKYNMEDSI